MAEFKTKDELIATLDKVVAALGEDETFKQRISRADMTIAFIVTDLDAAYTLKLNKGEVSGSEGDEASALGAIMSSATPPLAQQAARSTGIRLNCLTPAGQRVVAQTAAGYVSWPGSTSR